MASPAAWSAAAGYFLRLTLPPLILKPLQLRLLLVMGVIIMGLAVAWLPLMAVALLGGGLLFLSLLLLRPALGLFLLIPLIPFSPLVAVSAGGFKIGGMEILLAASLAAWLLQWLAHPYPNNQPALFAAPLFIPFLIFLAAVGLSWLNTLSLGASLVETLKWAEMLALYLFVVAALPARHLKWVVGVLLLAGAAQALLGLYQFVFKIGPEGFLLFGGLFLRAYGTFAQPNPYAGYLGLLLPLALSLTIWGAFEQETAPGAQGKFILRRPLSAVRSSPLALLSLLSFGLMLAAFFAAQSRAAWLAFAGAAAIMLAVRSKKTALLLLFFAMVVMLVMLVGTFETSLAGPGAFPGSEMYRIVSRRFVEAMDIVNITDIGTREVTDANFATIERLAHWQAAREMWRDHPWLGVGFGNYEVIYPAYAVGRWLNSLGHAHNYLLNIGAETGLAGITGYLIFWILAFRVTWRAVRGSDGLEQATAAGGLGILAHLHIHNLFDNLYVQGMYLHVAIILALVSVIYRNGYKHTGINYSEEDRVN